MRGYNIVFEVTDAGKPNVRKLHLDMTDDATIEDAETAARALSPGQKIKSINGQAIGR